MQKYNLNSKTGLYAVLSLSLIVLSPHFAQAAEHNYKTRDRDNRYVTTQSDQNYVSSRDYRYPSRDSGYATTQSDQNFSRSGDGANTNRTTDATQQAVSRVNSGIATATSLARSGNCDQARASMLQALSLASQFRMQGPDMMSQLQAAVQAVLLCRSADRPTTAAQPATATTTPATPTQPTSTDANASQKSSASADCGNHPDYSSWSAPCPSSTQNGQLWYSCRRGQITSENRCTEAPSCGADHPEGSQWSENECPAGTVGTFTYKCYRGGRHLVSSNCQRAEPTEPVNINQNGSQCILDGRVFSIGYELTTAGCTVYACEQQPGRPGRAVMVTRTRTECTNVPDSRKSPDPQPVRTMTTMPGTTCTAPEMGGQVLTMGNAWTTGGCTTFSCEAAGNHAVLVKTVGTCGQ